MKRGYCVDCVHCGRNEHGEACYHGDRTKVNYVTGRTVANACGLYNAEGECELFEKHPAREPGFRWMLRCFPGWTK